MNWRDTIDLITITSASDGVGGWTQTETTRSVFANRKSVRSHEFYQAHATGLRPDITFELRKIDYEDETRLSFSGATYDIIRTYSANEDFIELVCQKRTEEN